VIDISSQRWTRFAALAVLVAALGLSACGRKGPLDPPPGAAPTQSSLDGEPAAPASAGGGPRQTGGVTAEGKAVAPPPSGRNEPFILDWLIR
jgi:predicted small lipoprotein YifL